MPSITFTAPDGTSSTGQMSDDDYSKFQALPADQQASTLNSFATQHAATASANDSYSNDLKAGVGGAMQDLGSVAQGVGLTSAGNWLRDNAPQPAPAYTGRGGSFLPDLKSGQFSRAAGDLTHGLASGSSESALEAGGAVAGGALGSLVGPEGTAAGAVGGGLGAGAIGGVLGLGRHARLAAAGRAVTGSDLANAAPAAAGDAAIAGLTMGRVPGGTLGRTAAQGVGGAAQSTLDQYSDTGSVDPDQVANAAASGAAFGAVTGAAGEGKSAVGRVADRVQSSGEQYQPTDQTQAHSAIRTRDALLQSQKDASGTPGAVTDLNQVANNLKSSWVNDAQDRIAQMKQQGASADVIRDAASLLERAQRHNNRLYTGDLDILDQADHGLDEGQLQDFKNRLTDLNTLSTNSFKNQNVGPLSAIGSKIGGLATTAGLFATGNHAEAAMNLIAGSALENKIGAKIGAAGDRLMGTQKPAIVLAGQAADRANNGAPVAPVNPITPTDTSYVSPTAALARLKAAQAAQAQQASKANSLRAQMVSQGQASLPQEPVSKPLAPPPIRPAAQPPESVPLAPPPIQRSAPVDPLAANGVAPRAPLAPPPIQPSATKGASDAANVIAAAMDTHGQVINDQGAYDAATSAYRGSAMRSAQAADMEAPGAGLGDIITGIMDAHHPGHADASLPPAVKAAIRSETRSKTLAMKQGMASSALAMVSPEHRQILAKYLTPSLTHHG